MCCSWHKFLSYGGRDLAFARQTALTLRLTQFLSSSADSFRSSVGSPCPFSWPVAYTLEFLHDSVRVEFLFDLRVNRFLRHCHQKSIPWMPRLDGRGPRSANRSTSNPPAIHLIASRNEFPPRNVGYEMFRWLVGLLTDRCLGSPRRLFGFVSMDRKLVSPVFV